MLKSENSGKSDIFRCYWNVFFQYLLLTCFIKLLVTARKQVEGIQNKLKC